MRRACDLWNEGRNIHLAHAGLPPCAGVQALRLFAADELIEAGATPAVVMKAQGPHFNPDQPRVPAGSGRESGEWSGGAGIDTAGVKEWIARLALEAARRAARSLRPTETKPAKPEVVKPESKPPAEPEAEKLQLPGADANKLHHTFDDPRHGLDGLIAEFGSQESAFQAVAKATRDAVKAQGITGQYEIQVEVGGHLVTVKGRVYNGILNIGTIYIP